MSVYYTIKEHLCIPEISSVLEDAWAIHQVIEIMRGNLAALGALVLVDNACIFDLHMTADGKEYTCDDGIGLDYKAVLDAMSNATSLDLTVEYEHRWSASWGMYELVGPFALMEYMEKADPADLPGVFYSAWNTADCSDGPGILVAYGEHNGKTYRGTVDYTEVTEVPTGVWYNTDTLIFVEPETFDPEAHPGVIDACKAFYDLADGSDIDLDADNGLDFCLNNITLDSPEKGKRFIDAVTKLRSLMPDDFSMMGNFYDTSLKDARLMTIEETENGCCVKVAQV